jgi:transposase
MSKKGRKPNIEMIKKVKALKAQGLSYRTIEKITGHQIKTIYRWLRYDLKENE